jgi:hypothetical protein
MSCGASGCYGREDCEAVIVVRRMVRYFDNFSWELGLATQKVFGRLVATRWRHIYYLYHFGIGGGERQEEKREWSAHVK